MLNLYKIFLGKRGTWLWACQQMKKGKTVYRFRDSGVVKFDYDAGRRKIIAIVHWDTTPEAAKTEWGISMEDVFATDFKVMP